MLIPPGTSKKLLLIDDETSIREAVRLALEGQDVVVFEIFESPDATDGIEQARQIVPDVIILDLHLPVLTGFDFMDLIAREQALQACHIIMLTGDNTFENVLAADAKHISPFRFIAKPFNVSDLQAVVFEASGLLRS